MFEENNYDGYDYIIDEKAQKINKILGFATIGLITIFTIYVILKIKKENKK